jgi:hypothetical protein
MVPLFALAAAMERSSKKGITGSRISLMSQGQIAHTPSGLFFTR